MASKALLRRALLYVPGSNERMLEKARGIDVDCVVYDLEDSVTLARKASARQQILKAMSSSGGARERAVRINAVGTTLAMDDLAEMLKAPNLDTIVVPKVNKASDLTFVSDFISASGHPHAKKIRLIALIESARALMDIRNICASTSRLSGLIFGAEDFSLDLSVTRTPSLTEFVFARQTLVAAARAYNLDSAIDLVCTDYKDLGGALKLECEGGAGMGFTGKQCIHPLQVGVVQKLFSPNEQRVRAAVRLLCAEKVAELQGKGSWALDGKMVDRPVIEAARVVVEKAKLAGMPVEQLWKQFEGVVPEYHVNVSAV